MIVFRLAKAIYAPDLSGRGAEMAGGRWNSKGIPMLYTSTSRALCLVEIAVHVPLGVLPTGYELVMIQLPEKSIQMLDQAQLPSDWKSSPPIAATRTIGDAFIQAREHLALQVPSAVVQDEYNVLINPLHPDIRLVKIIRQEPFHFDQRFFDA